MFLAHQLSFFATVWESHWQIRSKLMLLHLLCCEYQQGENLLRELNSKFSDETVFTWVKGIKDWKDFVGFLRSLYFQGSTHRATLFYLTDIAVLKLIYNVLGNTAEKVITPKEPFIHITWLLSWTVLELHGSNYLFLELRITYWFINISYTPCSTYWFEKDSTKNSTGFKQF